MEGTSRYHRFAFACALLLAALGAACAEKAVAPDRESITPPPGTENVYIVSEGDVILNGRLFGAEHEAVVILSHMRPNDQSAWFPFAEELADNGYAALTFNFRGYGESEGDQDFNKLDEDLSAAVRYMRDGGKRESFRVGAMMRDTTSLVTAEGEAGAAASRR